MKMDRFSSSICICLFPGPKTKEATSTTTTAVTTWTTHAEPDLGGISHETHQLPVWVVHRLEEVRSRAIHWLLSKATDEYGWPGGDTARVVIALAASLDEWPDKNDLITRLIVKQMEVEVLEKLLRWVKKSYFYSSCNKILKNTVFGVERGQNCYFLFIRRDFT